MKIIQLIPRLPRAAERDFFAAVSRELERSGDTVRILSLLPGPATPPGVPFSALPERLLPWPGAGRSPELLTDLREYCRDADLLHLHGTLLYPVRYAAAIRRESACKVAWSPEGNCGFLLRLCGTLRRAGARVAATFRVSVLVMLCTVTGAPPPIFSSSAPRRRNAFSPGSRSGAPRRRSRSGPPSITG